MVMSAIQMVIGVGRAACVRPPLTIAVPLSDTLVLRVVTLLGSDHAPISLVHHGTIGSEGGQTARSHLLPHLRVVRHLRVVCILCCQSDSRVRSRGYYFALHVQEIDHAIQVKVLWASVFHLFAPTVDESFKGEHLSAVHVEGLAQAHEVLLSDRQLYFHVFDQFVHIVIHQF